ncbi:CMRF35-like molecule 7 [Chanos chanos]|uniref:CMRF35-like molecule 7 n=1 Tax=Chanos chanos TaxID=29144 RepID=A0A6J2WXW2_CHACN|nr:CMRF35-like molecule 7 [Chanos chanos]
MEFLLALIVVFLHGIPGSNGLWTVSRLTAKAGGSVTIPCHYHKMFRNHDKYWCKGKGWSTCIVLGGTNTRQRRANMTVTDDPTELVMTATMSNLKTTETNRYWCAVKIGGFMKPDVRTSLELTVTDDLPDLSAANSMLSAQQGGNVSVQCLYHNKMKYKEKKWCRSGDLHSCRSLDDLEPPQHGSLQISDDENGTFTVTVGGLEREDMGWYWCMAGDVQYPVHITSSKLDHSFDCFFYPVSFDDINRRFLEVVSTEEDELNAKPDDITLFCIVTF